MYVTFCLDQVFSQSKVPHEKQNTAFELAICYWLGFGVAKDDGQSECFLQHSTKRQQDFMHIIEDMKQEIIYMEYQDGLFKDLELDGQVTPIELSESYRGQVSAEKLEQHYRREISDIENSLGRKHASFWILNEQLIDILVDQGRWKEAKGLQRQQIESFRSTFGDNIWAYSTTLAWILVQQGRLREAGDLATQALKKDENRFGKGHAKTMVAKAALATVFRDQGQWKKAEELDLQLLDTNRRTRGNFHPWTLVCVTNLALTYKRQGLWKKAEELETEVLEKSRTFLADINRTTLSRIVNLAGIYLHQEKW